MSDSAQVKHHGQELLERAVTALPLPTAPPARSTRDVLGLHLIESALRLEHVDRVSEQLSLVDATHMARAIDIDVDIDGMPEGKEIALRPGGESASTQAPLYVPIARHPRESLGPVVLRDGNGNSLPRLTSRTTNRLLAAGMIRLFRTLASADGGPQSLRGGDLVPTWLIEAAILALIEDGRRDWPVIRHGTSMAAARKTAIDALPSLFTNDITPLTQAMWETPPVKGSYPGKAPRSGDSPHAFYKLLNALTADQFIIAVLPPNPRQVRISYDAPELRGNFRPAIRRIFLPTRDFTMDYETRIPADVDSFHVSIRVPSALEVRRFLMTSDADTGATTAVLYDIENLAHLIEKTAADERRSLLTRSERAGVSSRLDEILRRRAEDYREYQLYLDKLRDRGGFNRAAWRIDKGDPTDMTALLKVTRGGRRLVTMHRRVSEGSPLITTGDLEQLASYGQLLHDAGLGWDLHVDNDPRESAGHIQWRRHATGLGLQRDQTVRAKVFLSLSDANPTTAWQVLRFTVFNLLLVMVLVGSLWWFQRDQAADTSEITQSEVLVTLLLLIPGLLLNRLDLAPRHSVVSRLQVFPQAAAWGSILVNVLLAVAIAVIPANTIEDLRIFVYGVPVIVLLAFVIAVGSYTLAERLSRRITVPPFEVVPAWLRNETRTLPIHLPARTSVTFIEREGDVDV